MTKDNAHLFLPRIADLVAALAEGQLQWKNSSGAWEDTNNVTFDCDPMCYRRKPKPREFWIPIFDDGTSGYSWSSLDKVPKYSQFHTVIRVREVLE